MFDKDSMHILKEHVFCSWEYCSINQKQENSKWGSSNVHSPLLFLPFTERTDHRRLTTGWLQPSRRSGQEHPQSSLETAGWEQGTAEAQRGQRGREGGREAGGEKDPAALETQPLPWLLHN